MTLIRWRRDPFFSQLATLQDDMNRRFGSLFDVDEGGTWPTSEFTPPMDVSEDPENYTVTAEIPGMKPTDIHVDLVGRTLTIRGEKKVETEEKKENFHRIERTYGSFTRRVELPQSVDPERVKADYDQGVLTLKIAKAEEVKPRQIPIKTTAK
jgi:HSP20 family protein